jgi:hypothetical protein
MRYKKFLLKYGDMKKYHVVKTVATKKRQFCRRDCEVCKVEMRKKT